MQTELQREFTLGSYSLKEQKLLPEQQNKVTAVSINVSDYMPIVNCPVCEVRQLPDEKRAYHIIIEKHAQKFMQMFHRYGPCNKPAEKLCPFQGGEVRDLHVELVGKNNIITHYEENKTHREALSSYFTEEKVKSFIPVFKDLTNKWLKAVLDFPEAPLFRATERLVCRCLIIGILDYDKCDRDDISLNIKHWNTLLEPLESGLKTAKEVEIEKNLGFFHSFKNNVQDRLDELDKLFYNKLNSDEFEDLVERIYENGKAKEKSLCWHLKEVHHFSEEEVLETIKGLLVMGLKTTSPLLGFILYEYAKNPELQNRQAKNPKEIKNAYLEGLRCYSPAALQREAGTDMVFTYPEGDNVKEHYIRQGDGIVCLPYFSGHTEEWKDHEKFNPDRPNLLTVRQTPHFGSGPHHCIGEKVAETQILTILQEILSTATLETQAELPPLISSYVIFPKNDLTVKFTSK